MSRPGPRDPLFPLLACLLAASLGACDERDGESALDRDLRLSRRLARIDDRNPPPATAFQRFEPGRRIELLQAVDALAAAPDQDAAAIDALKRQIAASVPAPDVPGLYVLALAPVGTVQEAGFRPALLSEVPGGGEPLALTSVCLENDGCSACQTTVSRRTAALSAASLLSRRNRQDDEDPPEVKEFQNLCATISTAWSLVKLGAFSTSNDVPDRERAWTLRRPEGLPPVPDKFNRGLIRIIKDSQGHDPKTGTPKSLLLGAYEAFGGTCEAERRAPADSAGLKRWCEDLVAGNATKDYYFSISNGEQGHGMNIDSVTFNERTGRCEITVHDAGRQGTSGEGDDIDVLPGFQEWEVSPGGTAVSVRIQRRIGDTDEPSIDFDYWSGITPPYNFASHICCTIPKRDD